MAYSDDEAQTISMTLKILNTNNKSEVSLPPYNTIVEHLPDTQQTQVENSIALSTDSAAALADVTTIEITSGDYPFISNKIFSNNKSIKNIIITSDRQMFLID